MFKLLAHRPNTQAVTLAEGGEPDGRLRDAVGSIIFPSGNDCPAKEAGVVSLRVRGPDNTKLAVQAIIACLDDDRPEPPPEKIK